MGNAASQEHTTPARRHSVNKKIVIGKTNRVAKTLDPRSTTPSGDMLPPLRHLDTADRTGLLPQLALVQLATPPEEEEDDDLDAMLLAGDVEDNALTSLPTIDVAPDGSFTRSDPPATTAPGPLGPGVATTGVSLSLVVVDPAHAALRTLPHPTTVVASVEIRWLGTGKEQHVYVIGSFTHWQVQHRIPLARKPVPPGADPSPEFLVVVQLPQGVHKMVFLVDNEVRTLPLLATATDRAGNLVNWFDVVDRNTYHLALSSATTTPLEPAGGGGGGDYFLHQPLRHPVPPAPHAYMAPPTPYDVRQTGLHGLEPPARPGLVQQPLTVLEASSDTAPPPKPVYTNEIPVEFREPQGEAASELASERPEPPHLPPHLLHALLGKTLLHADVAAKHEDVATHNAPRRRRVGGALKYFDYHLAERVHVPNHVILNHLATTSIKTNVLAVACINRYHGKFVNLIIYLPIPDELAQ